MTPAVFHRVLRHYVDRPEALAVAPLGDGLINETYLVSGLVSGLEPGPPDRVAAGGHTGRAVLQRVNPIFDIAVHQDIEAVTRHLVAGGKTTPLLWRNQSGGLAVDLGAEGVWRLSTYVDGRSVSRVEPALCREAGRLVGGFHAALGDLAHRFRFSRPGAHDLAKHLQVLREAQAAPAQPAGFAALAEEIQERAAGLPAQVRGPVRVCHGDLKINNLLFSDEGRGVCLVDLDTLGHLPLAIEMGDALRSWCNPSPLGENDPAGTFDLGLFALAMDGYAESSAGFITTEEREGLVAGVERIALELSARFCADAVHDRYFRWDAARYPSRAAHNLVRAAGQLGVARAVAAQRSEAEDIAARAYRGLTR